MWLMAPNLTGWCMYMWSYSCALQHDSKKLCKLIFVSTLSNFHQLWKYLAQRWQSLC